MLLYFFLNQLSNIFLENCLFNLTLHICCQEVVYYIYFISPAFLLRSSYNQNMGSFFFFFNFCFSSFDQVSVMLCFLEDYFSFIKHLPDLSFLRY